MPHENAQHRVRNVLQMLKPAIAVGKQKVRVGRAGDGGYVMLEDFKPNMTAVSCGIADDCSWDYQLAERGMSVHQFDHTIDRPPQNHPLFVFHRKRVAAALGPGRVTLDEIAAMVSPPAIAKFDIEGDEWEILAAASVDTLNRYSQIVIELHWLSQLGDATMLSRIERAISVATHNFQSIHVHGNNASYMAVASNVAVPNVLEVTLANRSLYQFEPAGGVYPEKIDMPNDPTRPDLWLGTFTY